MTRTVALEVRVKFTDIKTEHHRSLASKGQEGETGGHGFS